MSQIYFGNIPAAPVTPALFAITVDLAVTDITVSYSVHTITIDLAAISIEVSG